MIDMIGKVLGDGRYRIDRELGGGGQGIVYRGTHLSLNIPIAIKILSFTAAGDHAMQVRFKREAQRTATLRHPNIVTIYDYAFEEGMYYIVSEFIDGTDLQHLLATSPGPMPINQVLTYVRQVGSALDYAHRQNIIHRDIKPGNILIDKHDERVVVVDFGLARMMEAEELTVTSARGGTPGTPAYMSPEQIMGDELDGGTDIYSLGMVVYEMVTGQNPFRGEHDTTASILYKQVHQTPPAPRALIPSLHPRIEAALLKMLAKDPKERYHTVGAFVKVLEQAQARPQKARASRTHQGLIRCPRCGANLPAGSKFCGACGASVIAEAKTARPRPAPKRRPSRPAPPRRRAAAPAQRPRVQATPPPPRRARQPAAVAARPPAAAAPFEYKNVMPRFWAFFIDGVFLSIAMALLYVGALSVGTLTDVLSDFEKSESAAIVEAGFATALVFVYFVLFEGWFGGTLGKLILGMRVVDKNGKKVGMGRALFRNLLRIIDFLPFGYVLGIILVACSSTKQRVGDRVAGSYVVDHKSLAGR